jgi:ribonuclease BN (tRNA processing enzyme)
MLLLCFARSCYVILAFLFNYNDMLFFGTRSLTAFLSAGITTSLLTNVIIHHGRKDAVLCEVPLAPAGQSKG